MHESVVSCAGVELLPPPLVVALVTVTVPPVPDMAIAPPAPSAAETLLKPTEKLDAPVPKVSVSEATTPLGIAVVFVPPTTHAYDPEPPVQETVFPTAVAPGEAVIDATLAAE